MKKKLRLMMTMLLLAVMGSAWAETETETETIVLSTVGYENAQVVSSTQGNVVTLTYNKGTSATDPAYYNTGSGVRVYAGGNMTVTADGNTITKVVVTYTKTNSPTIDFSSNGTTTSSTADSPATWEGSATGVLFNVTKTGHARIQRVAVTYSTSGGQSIETVATPTFSPAEGTYNEAQNVEISTTTDDATIYYTLNGDEPTTTSSSVYSGAITIDETTTIKAIAIKEGMNNSEVASATYTITTATPAVNFIKVTNSNQLVVGNEYILVAYESSVAMGKPNSTNKIRGYVDVIIDNNKVAVNSNDISVLTLGGSAGAWTFQDGAYLAYSGDSNELHIGTDPTQDACKWIVTSDFQLQPSTNTNRYIRYNSGSPRFACYKSGQVIACLYVKENSPIDDKIDPELAFTPTTVTAEVGGAFTAPTLSSAAEFDGAIAYASSNPEVATVDSSTGEVTIVAAGETTISATSEATDNFKAGYASYTLTVEVASHNVTFSANGTTFSTITAKEGANIEFPTENPADEGDYKFIGWSTEDWIGEKENSPTTLVTSATMGTEDMTIYAVYAITTEGTSVRWKKMAASEVTEEGTYAIITSTEGSNAYYAFNGTITSGHGQTTPNYFTFDTDGYADSAPAGTCELIFEASGEGFKMRTEDLTANGNKPYLCASKAASGGLTWSNSSDYWSYTSDNWTYSKYFDGTNHYAYLRQYDKTVRTYGTNSGRKIEFAQKVGSITYSNYCTIISGFEKVTLSTDGYITYVTKNAIDWVQTLARNSQEGVDVHGYKVVDFSLDNGVSMVEYGVENLSTVASTDKMYQEPIIPAGTPIIIQGKQGDNYMVVADEENVTAPAGNLLRASNGTATTTDEVKLFVLQKIDQSGSGINNYTFYRLTKGRQIPVGKAYLSSEDMTLPNPGTPGVDPNNMPAANFIRILVQTDNDSLVSDDAGIIDGIGTVAQDSEDGQVIYNLNGVKVNNPSKGIYVKNGKKVIIK